MIIYFIILGVVAIYSMLVYGELVCRTKGKHRLPGYVGLYLGKKLKITSLVSQIIGITGALIAYLLVGGNFLAEFLIPFFGGTKLLYIFIFFATGSLIIYFTSKEVAQTEFAMLIFFFIVIILLLFKTAPFISLSNFSTVNLKYFFLPYGVVLFSIWGASIIPEVKEFLAPKHLKLLKPTIVSGIIISIITYILFTIAILGVTGNNTTPDALSGLKNFFHDGVISTFLIFGVLTTFTSYITLGLTLKKIFWYDFKIPHFTSWIIVVIIPIGLYLLGLTNFILIMSFTGAVTLGIDTITIFLCYLKSIKKNVVKPPYSLRLPPPLLYGLMTLFLIGIIIELITVWIK